MHAGVDCRFASTTALENLGQAYINATKLMTRGFNRFHRAAEATYKAQHSTKPALPGPGAEGKEPGDAAVDVEEEEEEDAGAAAARLQAQVVGPLTGVQASLMLDTVAWKHGILVMPKVRCPAGVAACTVRSKLKTLSMICLSSYTVGRSRRRGKGPGQRVAVGDGDAGGAGDAECTAGFGRSHVRNGDDN